MKSKHPDLSQRYMLLIKQDAHNLYHRIKERESEYIEAFSLKRDRSIFSDVFYNRYKQATMFDLSHLSLELIEVVNDFYQEADELYWYLMNTQDMPTTIEDEVIRFCANLKRKYENLELYIDAELSGAPPLPEEDLGVHPKDSLN